MYSTNFLVKHPRKVGAIAPSSNHLAERMVERINFKKATCIVEYGPGLGSFTRKLVEYKKRECKLILIEQNNEFCTALGKEYFDREDIAILNESAENIEDILGDMGIEKADYVVSGLPFTSLPTKVSNKILSNTKRIIRKEGGFLTFQYSLVRRELLLKYFVINNISKVRKNFPPAYVFECKVI
ncbi:MAG TPA: rRNA adenine N-6-methyltransferase family protein [Lachnospiraceae bacterium]|nr:rRNA adenine N-6-methyltransferase family protein [Lachnospiraceae bacterium]